MNRIVKVEKNGELSYQLIVDSGKKYDCTLWFEKKTDAWHVKLPKDNESGRTYVRKAIVDANPKGFEFPTKTEFRKGLVGGGWRSKMTPEESKRMTELEAEIEAIKTLASSREVAKVDPNTIEGIEAQIAKLLAKKEKMAAKV